MVQVRKLVFIRELITSDSFGEPCEPVSRVAAAAVIHNPLAGRFETDLSALFECGGGARASTRSGSCSTTHRGTGFLWEGCDCRRRR